MKTAILSLVLAAAVSFSGLVHAAPKNAAKMPSVDIKVTQAGTGQVATRYATVRVHYTGRLLDGTKFDSSHDRGEPIEFVLGQGQVIAGWEMGIEGMKVGGKRSLTIPPELAYGKRGAGKVIPPNATLTFDVELVSLTPPKFNNVSNDELAALIARGVPVIDIRRPEEWKQTGIVAGSHMITAFGKNGRFKRDFMTRFEEIVKDKDSEVVLICRTGNRTGYLSNALSGQLGYTKLHNVTDGITRWIGEKRPVVKP